MSTTNDVHRLKPEVVEARPLLEVSNAESALSLRQFADNSVVQLRTRWSARPRLWRYLRGAHIVFLIRHPEITIPDNIAQGLQQEGEEKAYLRFEVAVNRTLKSSVQLERFRTRNFAARLAVMLYWFVLVGSERWEPGNSRTFWRRACRVLFRNIRKGVEYLRSRIVGDETSVSVSLNKHILTQKLHLLPEFAFPAGLHVALTKNCNLRCIMCPYHAEELRKQHTVPYFAHGLRMPESILERILKEAGHYKANISFGQYDEPFIYKGFAKWAARAKDAGCTVAITTNGTLLNEVDARILLEAKVEHISFSLDAASAETYRKIRLDDFEVPIRNLRRLVAMRDQGRYPTQIRACLVLQEHNKHETELFLALMNTLGVDVVSFYNLSVLDHGVWKFPALNFDVAGDKLGERNVCSQLYNQLAIYPDGQVALCCLTTMYVGYRTDVPYVGNVNTQTIQEIWLSEPYLRIRKEAFEKTFSNSVCRDCTIWHNYQGREQVDEKGRRVYKNAYETFVYLR